MVATKRKDTYYRDGLELARLSKGDAGSRVWRDWLVVPATTVHGRRCFSATHKDGHFLLEPTLHEIRHMVVLAERARKRRTAQVGLDFG